MGKTTKRTTEMKTLQQSLESLRQVGFNFGDCALRTNIPNAKGQMGQVMREVLPQPVWLPEYDEIAEWLTDNKGKGLLLAGQPGLGKTVMATKVIPVLLHANMGKLVRPISAYDINKQEKNLEYHTILIIDDIGVEDDKNDYGEKRRVFADIVDRAERRGDILILTTNLTSKALSQRYGERIADRLRALTRLIVIRGTSLRK